MICKGTEEGVSAVYLITALNITNSLDRDS